MPDKSSQLFYRFVFSLALKIMLSELMLLSFDILEIVYFTSISKLFSVTIDK